MGRQWKGVNNKIQLVWVNEEAICKTESDGHRYEVYGSQDFVIFNPTLTCDYTFD